MGGGGSAAAMNTVINNNRKLLKRKAREKMAYNGLISKEIHNGYTFDEKIYDEKEKSIINENIAKRKRQNLIANIWSIVLSIIFIGIILLFYFLL